MLEHLGVLADQRQLAGEGREQRHILGVEAAVVGEDDERPGGCADTPEGGGGEADCVVAGLVLPCLLHHGGTRGHRLPSHGLQLGRVRSLVAARQSQAAVAVGQIEAGQNGLHHRRDTGDHARQLRLDIHRVGERLAEHHIDVDELLGETADLV